MVSKNGHKQLEEILPGNIINKYKISDSYACPYAEGAFKKVYVVEKPSMFMSEEEKKKEESEKQLHVMKIFKKYAEITADSAKRDLNYINNDRVQKFSSEINRLQSVEGHPNIARIVDHGCINIGKGSENEVGILYFVEDFVKGKTLKEVMDEAKNTPKMEGLLNQQFYNYTVKIFHQLAKAINYMHKDCKMSHLDIKPSNILIREKPENQDRLVVITDFGNASLLSEDSYYNEGSLLYRSPERFKKKKVSGDFTMAEDMWCYGLLLYECITGHYPFQTSKPDWSKLSAQEIEDQKNELKKNISKINCRPMNEFNPFVTPALETLVKKIMTKEPEHRLGIRETLKRISGIAGAKKPNEK